MRLSGCIRTVFAGGMMVLLTSCAGIAVSSEIVGSTADRVWIKRPFLVEGDSDEIAAEFCAKTDRTAVFESEMAISDAKRIAIYLCQ